MVIAFARLYRIGRQTALGQKRAVYALLTLRTGEPPFHFDGKAASPRRPRAPARGLARAWRDIATLPHRKLREVKEKDPHDKVIAGL